MRVILIGFMGVGKTSVGKKLAKKLNFDFIDTDYEIEILANKTIPDIFEQDGEKHFRKLESIILKKFIKKEDVVISTGGGIITTKENYNILKNEENVIFLDASVETIISHLQNERNKRPLLKECENLNKKIELGYVFTALLAIAIGGVDNRREEMVAILIAVMIFSIGCSLEANKINEYYKCGFFKLKELFLDKIKNIDEDMIYDLGKISYNFKSKRVTG